MLPPEFIEYFKALVEGNQAAEHWTTWWKAHESQMAELLTPGVFLRLRHTPYHELYSILEAEGFHYPRPKHYRHAKFRVPEPVPTAWLTEKISLAVVEEEVSPGHLATDLAAIKEALQPGDEVWKFSSPKRNWEGMMGRSGFAFVRKGIPYDSIVTLMN